MEDRLRFYSISPVDLLFEADQLLLSPDLQNGFIRFALVCLKDGGCLDAPKAIARAARLNIEDAGTLRAEMEDVCEVREGKIAPKLVWGLIEHAEMKSQKARNSALAKASNPAQTQADASDSNANGKRKKANASERKRTQANASERVLSEVKLSEVNNSGANAPGADAPDADAPDAAETSPDYPAQSDPPADPTPSPSVAFKNTVVAAFVQVLSELDPDAPPYTVTSVDCIQVEALRKRCLKGKDGKPWEMTPENLARALTNYRASPIGERTLADFAARFSTFYRNALDRYSKPVSPEGKADGRIHGSGNGTEIVAGSLPSESGDGGKWAYREI